MVGGIGGLVTGQVVGVCRVMVGAEGPGREEGGWSWGIGGERGL